MPLVPHTPMALEMACCFVNQQSPYLTEHIKRFGQYVLDMDTPPEPLQPKPLFGVKPS